MLILIKRIIHVPDENIDDASRKVHKAMKGGYDVVVSGPTQKKVMTRVNELFEEDEGEDDN